MLPFAELSATRSSATTTSEFHNVVTDPVAVVRFSWDSTLTACRASAYDASGQLLGQVAIEFPEETRRRIWGQRGQTAQLRIEEIAERQLRTMLELRY